MANVFALEADQIVGVITEKTGGMVLFENDGFFVYEDFNGVFDVDAKGPAKLNRDDHPTESIHFPNDTR